MKKIISMCLCVAILACCLCFAASAVHADDWESELDQELSAVRGDMDGNSVVNNKDVEYLLWHTLFAEDYPVNQNVDFDENGSIDNKDVEYLLWHTLFPEDYPLPAA